MVPIADPPGVETVPWVVGNHRRPLPDPAPHALFFGKDGMALWGVTHRGMATHNIRGNEGEQRMGNMDHINSGDETATGEKIYTTEDVTDGAPGVERVSLKTEHGGATHKTVFEGTTNNGLTALITYNNGIPVAVNTANVVVKSLTDKTTAKDINELNELASVNATVQVALQYAEKGSNVVTCIYVVDVVKA